MFAQHPKNPAVMLVVAAGFITPGSIQDTFLGSKVSRQSDSALVVEPGIEAFLRLAMIAAPIQVDDHHTRLIPISAVREGADPRKSARTVRLQLAVNQQVSGIGSEEIV